MVPPIVANRGPSSARPQTLVALCAVAAALVAAPTAGALDLSGAAEPAAGDGPALAVPTPVTEPLAAATDAAAPVGELVAPVTDAVRPVTDAVQPVADEVRPVTEAVRPVTEAVAPVVGAVADAGGQLLGTAPVDPGSALPDLPGMGGSAPRPVGAADDQRAGSGVT
ncbi:MAG TPA: hypothetical protein VK904_06425, partial [Miltoncostaeaceae bacterium]|nr:hypothetical protein [Miltoncostaeaceae bacterium]